MAKYNNNEVSEVRIINTVLKHKLSLQVLGLILSNGCPDVSKLSTEQSGQNFDRRTGYCDSFCGAALSFRSNSRIVPLNNSRSLPFPLHSVYLSLHSSLNNFAHKRQIPVEEVIHVFLSRPS
jgi:hypothetical protein